MQQTNKMLPYLVIVLFILIGVSVFLYFYNFPQKINQTYSAMKYRENDPQSEKATKVIIKGTFKQPLFRDPTFSGKLIIDNYEITQKYDLIDIVFFRKVDNGLLGSLTYYLIDKDLHDLEPLGLIWIDKKFEHLNMQIIELEGEEQKAGRDIKISAPATNYDEAMLINKKLVNYVN
jgi:hypothetical protein